MSNSIRLVPSGEPFFRELRKLIGQARRELHFQTYRIEDDETGASIIRALAKAARGGAAVHVLLDAYGCKDMPPEFTAKLEEAGARVRCFSPYHTVKGLFVGRRLHHKVAVADGEAALLGGINVAGKYRGTPGKPAWLDFAAWVEGKPCLEAERICKELWGRRFFAGKRRLQPAKPPSGSIKIAHNDWFRHRNDIAAGYRQSVRNAQESIVLVAGYFLPGIRFRRALAAAARRGVSVKIILPDESDMPVMRSAARWLYDYLHRHGIETHEWQRSVLHGKAMSVDGRWCTLGSFNLISLSAYGSVETNVETTDKEFVEAFDQHLRGILKKCRHVTKDLHQKRATWWRRLRNWLAYRFVRRVFFLMTFFSYHRWFTPSA